MNCDNIVKMEPELIFQVVDWYGKDRQPDDDDVEDNGRFVYAKSYDVNLFGRTESGESVALQVTGFHPFFYIRVPQYFTYASVQQFRDFILKKKRVLSSLLLGVELIERFPFSGFTNNTKSKFMKLTFETKQGSNMCRRIFQNVKITPLYPDNPDNDEKEFKTSPKSVFIPGLTQRAHLFELYESNVDPMIRLGHLRNIFPSGWIKVSDYTMNNMNPTNCDIAIQSSWDSLHPYKKEEIGPIRVCAFDIECTSSHGDFPQAMKTYETAAREIVTDIQRLFTTTLDRDAWGHNAVMSKSSKDEHRAILMEYFNFIFSIAKTPTNEKEIQSRLDCSRIHTVVTLRKKKPSLKTMNYVIEKLMKLFDSKKLLKLKKKKATVPEEKEGAILSFLQTAETQTRVCDVFIHCKQQYGDKGIQFVNAVRHKIIERVCAVFDQYFPKIEGDAVVQISNCFMDYGTNKPVKKILFTVGECDDILDCDVRRCSTEEEMLIKWTQMVQTEDPDIVAGYNSYGFDLPYMYNRSKELGILERFQKLSKFSEHCSEMKKKRLASAALGDNIWFDVPIVGRIHVDVMRVVQRDFNLSSWKLDYVASYFMNGGIKNLEQFENENDSDNDGESKDGDGNAKSDGNDEKVRKYLITTDNTKGLLVDSFVNIQINNGLTTDMYGDHSKFRVISVSPKTITIQGDLCLDEINFTKYKCTWCHAKDDMAYTEIFDTFNSNEKTPENRAKRAAIGKYCMKDSILCIDLIKKLEIVANNIGMSNVCSVPLSWIFSRGQGAKTLSLVAKQCAKDGFLIPVMYMDKANDAEFEGAIVLDPMPGIYLDSAIATLDYASLYPSCIISENMSHDSIVVDEKWKGDAGACRLRDAGYEYIDIQWDVYKTVGTKKKKIKKETTRFVQFPNGEKGIIPRILMDLLKARKKTRKRIKYKTVTTRSGKTHCGLLFEDDDGVTHIKTESGDEVCVAKEDLLTTVTTHSEFQQGILDGLQKAYKITANSIYGQMGAKTSPVKMIPIAACTTATGRSLLMTAKNFIHEKYHDRTIVLPERSVYVKNSTTIYGDTDSVFVKFNLYDKKGGTKLKGKDLLRATIAMGIDAGTAISKTLKKPHDLEYEKAFYPFVLLSKKRYVGMKYEYSVDKCKQTSMGIVLKRRDNAKILKFVFGGAIDIIMKEQNVRKAFKFVQETVKEITTGKYGMDYLVITKSLRTGYKNPESIAHKVLADRMGDRDPGNRPKSNDRIPYVFIVKQSKKGEKILQGNRIENPSFIEKHGLDIDYQFYITNQIAKPVSQVFALIINQLPNFRLQKKAASLHKQINRASNEEERKKLKKRLRTANEVYASELLFSDSLRKMRNSRSGQKEITHFMNIHIGNARKNEEIVVNKKEEKEAIEETEETEETQVALATF